MNGERKEVYSLLWISSKSRHNPIFSLCNNIPFFWSLIFKIGFIFFHLIRKTLMIQTAAEIFYILQEWCYPNVSFKKRTENIPILKIFWNFKWVFIVNAFIVFCSTLKFTFKVSLCKIKDLFNIIVLRELLNCRKSVSFILNIKFFPSQWDYNLKK